MNEGKRKVFSFTNKEEWLALRSHDVTSTEVSALFNCNPYITIAELWHRKKGAYEVTVEESEYMRWGTRLQNTIAQGIAEDNQWNIRKADEYIRHEDLRLGASFDFMVQENGSDVAILEIKNVGERSFRDGWLIDDDGEVEAPPHIEMQIQHQLAVTGMTRAYIGALVGGNTVRLLPRMADQAVISAIKLRVKEFWQSVENNQPPSWNYERDADLIVRLNQYAEPDKEIQANVEIEVLVGDYLRASSEISELESIKESLKAKLILLMGTAEKVNGDTFTITAGMVGPKRIEYDRAGYRSFKVTKRKAKSLAA